MQERFVSLESLKGGAILEAFDIEFQNVLRNIVDPNTPATAKRQIMLKAIIIPSSDRESCRIQIGVESKVAASTPVETVLLISAQGNLVAAVEQRYEQTNLFRDS
jgi:hypothetical protein